MSTQQELLEHLLKLYPIKAVKNHFNFKGTATDVITDILKNHKAAEIRNFATSNFILTKQNIHLFHLSRPFNKKLFDSINFPYTISHENTNGAKTTLVFFIKVEFSVFVDNPPGKEDIEFLQPVSLVFENKTLRVHFTKLKKNVQSYFSDSRNPKLLRIKNSDSDTIPKILQSVSTAFQPNFIDINRGIKKLWADDEIDCRKLKWRDHHSLELTLMDEEETFKVAYPERYEEVALAPIEQSVFSYLKEDDYLCSLFGVNPSFGQLNISKFPKDSDQVSNVIEKILANN
jgi:hypothetical protein